VTEKNGESGVSPAPGREAGRTLPRVLWGGGTAVAATAAIVAVTLPRDASGNDGRPAGPQ
jgi:hypothetical protein